jgi:hypothetical protein
MSLVKEFMEWKKTQAEIPFSSDMDFFKERYGVVLDKMGVHLLLEGISMQSRIDEIEREVYQDRDED